MNVASALIVFSYVIQINDEEQHLNRLLQVEGYQPSRSKPFQ